MSIEKPCQPSPEEIKKAEKIMTPEQKEKSKEREATLEKGKENITEQEQAKDKLESIIENEVGKNIKNYLDKISKARLEEFGKPDRETKLQYGIGHEIEHLLRYSLFDMYGLSDKSGGRDYYRRIKEMRGLISDLSNLSKSLLLKTVDEIVEDIDIKIEKRKDVEELMNFLGTKKQANSGWIQ